MRRAKVKRDDGSNPSLLQTKEVCSESTDKLNFMIRKDFFAVTNLYQNGMSGMIVQAQENSGAVVSQDIYPRLKGFRDFKLG